VETPIRQVRVRNRCGANGVGVGLSRVAATAAVRMLVPVSWDVRQPGDSSKPPQWVVVDYFVSPSI
jgi:hypothetical protein